jgi:hypothetical protein
VTPAADGAASRAQHGHDDANDEQDDPRAIPRMIMMRTFLKAALPARWVSGSVDFDSTL